MAAGDEQVDGRLAHVHAQRAELLDRVDDEQDAGGAAELRRGSQVDAVAVAPLDRADDDGARPVVHDLGERLRAQRAADVPREPHLGDAALLCELDERDRDLEELEVGEDDVVAGSNGIAERREVQALRRALDERDLVVARAEQPGALPPRVVADRVERDVVLGRVALVAGRAATRDPLDRADGLLGREPDAGAVEEGRVPEAGERGACGGEVHSLIVRASAGRRIAGLYGLRSKSAAWPWPTPTHSVARP